jgi:7-cyano-7-deazaguanine synthase
MRKAFVLLSGGLDSTTCLGIAMQQCSDVEAVSINYGQRHTKEIEHARRICNIYGIPHRTLNLGGILTDKNTMLARGSKGLVDIPDISYDQIKGVSPTYVPFRNGTMLSVLAAHVQKWVVNEIERKMAEMKEAAAEDSEITDPEVIPYRRLVATDQLRDAVGIYFGAHAEDAANWAYPDCTPEFIGAMANAIYIGTYMTVRLYTPLMWYTKAQIVAYGDKLGVPFADTWSCYKGEEVHCGVCPTCRARKEAFRQANVNDPTTYGDRLPVHQPQHATY